MPAPKKTTKQPRGSSEKPTVNTDGKLMTKLPRNLKKDYLGNADMAITVFNKTWEDLKVRCLNFPAAFDLCVLYAIEVNGYFYAKEMAGVERVTTNDRGGLMIHPWVKIEQSHLRQIQSLAKALGVDPYTRIKMPEAPEQQPEEGKSKLEKLL